MLKELKIKDRRVTYSYFFVLIFMIDIIVSLTVYTQKGSKLKVQVMLSDVFFLLIVSSYVVQKTATRQLFFLLIVAINSEVSLNYRYCEHVYLY